MGTLYKADEFYAKRMIDSPESFCVVSKFRKNEWDEPWCVDTGLTHTQAQDMATYCNKYGEADGIYRYYQQKPL